MARVSLRLAALSLVLGGALAEAAGQHRLAYYALVAAVPVVALAALHGFGAVLDTTPRQPFERAGVALSTLAVPLLLVATAVRAPVAGDVPPRLGVTALVACLIVLCVQTALAGLASLVVEPRPALEGD